LVRLVYKWSGSKKNVSEVALNPPTASSIKGGSKHHPRANAFASRPLLAISRPQVVLCDPFHFWTKPRVFCSHAPLHRFGCFTKSPPSWSIPLNCSTPAPTPFLFTVACPLLLFPILPNSLDNANNGNPSELIISISAVSFSGSEYFKIIYLNLKEFR
jgi:hypothetical protein